MARGRPREFDTDAALDKAIDLFWVQGYEGTTIDQLTETMGIGTPSLYAAFGSKRHLFELATDRYTASRSHYLLDALAMPTATEVAQTFLEGTIEAATCPDRPPGCFTVQAGLTCSNDDQEVATLLAERRAATEAALRNRFRRESRTRPLPAGMTPASLARFLTALAVGINVKAADGAGRRELRTFVKPITDLLAG